MTIVPVVNIFWCESDFLIEWNACFSGNSFGFVKMINFLFQKVKRPNERYYNGQSHISPIPHVRILSISKFWNFQNLNFPRNKSLDLQRVDIINVSHTRREREPAKDKFEHWIERIKTLHFTSFDKIKIEKDFTYIIS